MTITLEFDFEKDALNMLPKSTDDTIHSEIGSFKVGDQKHRVIVCRHWLLGLCFNGLNCSYLHRLDKDRMPPCKHGKLCKIKNCPLKHMADEEMEECIFYKQGFCYNGPKCSRRHLKRTPEECPLEAAFEPISTSQAQTGKKLKTGGQPNDNYKVTLCTHWLLNSTCPFGEECHYAHGEEDINQGYQPNAEFFNDFDIYDPTRHRLDVPLELPFPQNSRCSFFILQAPDLRSLTVSKRRGVWAAPSRMAGEMNAAFRSSDHVVIYFSVRPLRGIYGVARMNGMIPQAHMPSPITPEFPVQWLRTVRLALRTIGQLKLGNTGMFVGRSNTDGRFENRAGLDMLLTAYRKPLWDWTQELERAEAAIRIVDSGAHQYASQGEYFPGNGVVPYFLPPDVLFYPDWIERAGMSVNEKGMILVHKSGDRAGRGDTTGASAEVYNINNPGFIVCADPTQIDEMLKRGLCGVPMEFKEQKILAKTPIFIFDIQQQVLLGAFVATAASALNVEPTAFKDWSKGPDAAGGSLLPVQFPVRPIFDCPPIPVPYHDPELQAVLGEYARNLGALGGIQTRNLGHMFFHRARMMFPGLPIQMPGSAPSSNFNQGQGHGGGMGGRGGGRGGPMGKPGMGAGMGGNVVSGSGYYRPPFKCVDTVPVDIPHVNINELKKRLLGPSATIIIGIVDSIGSKHNLRIRMRGMGSGFTEGPQQLELPEPLHFNVSADSEQLLKTAMETMKEHIDKVRASFL